MTANEYTKNAIVILKLECEDRKFRITEDELDQLSPMFEMGRENGYSPEELAVILADEIKRQKSL